MSFYLAGLATCLQPLNLLLIAAVVIVGIIFGAIRVSVRLSVSPCFFR